MTLVDSPRYFLLPTFLLAFLASPPEARAQSADAEVLFREGRKLVKAGRLEAGCDKIEASEKIESSVGTLLNLGDCREKLGRHASAWAAFRKAEAQAKIRGGDEKRRNEASKRALVLEGKLSQLVIMVTGKIDGLVIKRDDEVIAAPMWNTPLPVDPDTYTIVAEAPGYKPWRTEINVTGKQRRQVVSVPSLEKAPVAVAPKREQLAPTNLPPVIVEPPAPQPTALVVDRPRERSMWTTSRKVAIGVGVVGAAALGTGVYFGMRSKDDEDKSNELCPGSLCDVPEGLRLNDRAQDNARNANILYAAGGAALAAGVVLWLVGGPDDNDVRVTPEVNASGAGVSFGGKF